MKMRAASVLLCCLGSLVLLAPLWTGLEVTWQEWDDSRQPPSTLECKHASLVLTRGDLYLARVTDLLISPDASEAMGPSYAHRD